MAYLILGGSILIQLVAAVLSLRLVRLTGYRSPWVVIAAALVLMSIRRSVTFYDIVIGGAEYAFSPEAELLALAISVLMLLGVILVRPAIVALIESRQKMQESEAIFRGILNDMTETYYRTDAEGKIVMASPSAEKLLGYRLDEVMGLPLSELYTYPEEREEFLARLHDSGLVENYESRLTRKDGSKIIVETNAHWIRDGEGNVTGVEGIARDVTARKQAEQLALRLGRIIEDSVNEIYIFDAKTLNFILVNRGARGNLGYSMEELAGLTPVDIKPQFTREEFEELIEPLRDGTVEVVEFEAIHRRKDGSTYPVEIDLQLARTESPPVFFAIVQNISERLSAEEKLAQASKMEAVGQLTGGIAHDFNNLLTVIAGNMELAMSGEEIGPEVEQRLTAALDGVSRGATLTQRLLAFSRKQALRPEVTDLRELIKGMSDLLHRTLREDIEIEIIGGGRLWLCEVDQAQLENVLLNLAINARDAMPNGGKLTIETTNAWLDEEFSSQHFEVEPGQYVLLAVSDTGVGMTPSIKAQVFDPFFTTKEEGKGSGLGLSMVYGFVKQSGGNIDIYSEVGEGTTVKIYLPRTHNELPARSDSLPSDADYGGRKQSILVVEDNLALGKVVTEMLVSLNYTTRYSPDAQGAIRLMEEDSNVDLLLTDVILPGPANGRDLVEIVQQRWPDTAVLYMSGYTENAIIHDGRLDPDVDLLSKPFTKQQLARKVSDVLLRKDRKDDEQRRS